MSTTTIVDPTTLTGPVSPAYDISKNNLQDIFEYNTSSFGQISLTSRVSRPAGSHLCYITTHTAVAQTTWSSVQTSKTTHVEFSSGLLYINHSCSPTVEIKVHEPDTEGNYANGTSGGVRVAGDRDLQVGDEVTFFYPSTEWESPRPFKCLCGTQESGDGKRCIGTQRGSKFLNQETLERYFMNQHVVALVSERT